MNNKRGNVPGHGKHRHRATQQQHTDNIDMPLVFGRKE